MEDYNDDAKISLYESLCEKDYAKFFLIHSYYNLLKEYINNEKTVFHLPCGSGNLSIEMLKNKPSYYVGVDLSASMLEFSKTIFEKEKIPIDKYCFLQHDAVDCKQITDRLGDVGISRHLFCFAKDYEELVKMARTVYLNLKDDAVFISYSCPKFNEENTQECIKDFERICDSKVEKYEKSIKNGIDDWPKHMIHKESNFVFDRFIWPTSYIIKALKESGFSNITTKELKAHPDFEMFNQLNKIVEGTFIIAKKIKSEQLI